MIILVIFPMVVIILVYHPQRFKKMYSSNILCKNSYFFKVCRIEPENNIDLVLRAFSQPGMPDLCIVGNWSNSQYGRSLLANYQSFDNMLLLNSIYNLQSLTVYGLIAALISMAILLEVRTLL